MLRKLGRFPFTTPRWVAGVAWKIGLRNYCPIWRGIEFSDLNELKCILFCCRKLNTLELRRLREGGQQQNEEIELSPSKKRSTESGGRGAVPRVSAARNLFSGGTRTREDPREHQDLTREEIALMFMEVSCMHWGKLTRRVDDWKIMISYIFLFKFMRWMVSIYRELQILKLINIISAFRLDKTKLLTKIL